MQVKRAISLEIQIYLSHLVLGPYQLNFTYIHVVRKSIRFYNFKPACLLKWQQRLCTLSYLPTALKSAWLWHFIKQNRLVPIVTAGYNEGNTKY